MVKHMDKLSKKALKEQYKNRVLVGGVYRIQCNANDAFWVRAAIDLQGSKNRFQFSLSMDSSPEPCMAEAWNQFGKSSFSYEILEELQKKELQTEGEFAEDINILLEIWTDKLSEGGL